MAVKTRLALVPNYVRDFACIGDRCEDTCCVGWRVDIDKATYKKYMKVKDAELLPVLSREIKLHKTQKSAKMYGYIEMDEQQMCPLLTEVGLCSVQQKLGEEYLSNVCATYPRTVNEVNGVLENGLTISCPEAARLALLNPAGIEFDEIEEPVLQRRAMDKKLTTTSPMWQGKPQQYFWELRVFIIGLLQDRAYSVEERMILLGMFMQKIQEAADQERVEEIPSLIQQHEAKFADGAMKSQLEGIPAKPSIQIKVIQELASKPELTRSFNKRLAGCVEEFSKGLQYEPGMDVDVLTSRYQQMIEQHYKPFLRDREYILENYLVTHVFNNLFPFGSKDQLFQSFVKLTINFSMIRSLMIGVAAYEGALTEELAVRVIQSYSKKVDHSFHFSNVVDELLTYNNFKTLPHLIIFIKST